MKLHGWGLIIPPSLHNWLFSCQNCSTLYAEIVTHFHDFQKIFQKKQHPFLAGKIRKKSLLELAIFGNCQDSPCSLLDFTCCIHKISQAKVNYICNVVRSPLPLVNEVRGDPITPPTFTPFFLSKQL
jgi:hypothetical protein